MTGAAAQRQCGAGLQRLSLSERSDVDLNYITLRHLLVRIVSYLCERWSSDVFLRPSHFHYSASA